MKVSFAYMRTILNSPLVKYINFYLEEILVVFVEWRSVEFVDELTHSDNIALSVFDRHAQDAVRFETQFFINLQTMGSIFYTSFKALETKIYNPGIPRKNSFFFFSVEKSQ